MCARVCARACVYVRLYNVLRRGRLLNPWRMSVHEHLLLSGVLISVRGTAQRVTSIVQPEYTRPEYWLVLHG